MLGSVSTNKRNEHTVVNVEKPVLRAKCAREDSVRLAAQQAKPSAAINTPTPTLIPKTVDNVEESVPQGRCVPKASVS